MSSIFAAAGAGPTTPSDELLRLLAEHSDKPQGLPIWLQIVLPLLVAAVAYTVGALGRSHDRVMRLKDAARTELVTALAALTEATEALHEAKWSVGKVVAHQQMDQEIERQRAWVTMGDPNAVEALKKATDRYAALDGDLRSLVSKYESAVTILKRQSETLPLFFEFDSPVLTKYHEAFGAHIGGEFWVKGMEPPFREPQIEPANLEATLKEQAQEADLNRQRFALEARKYVQPQPTVWEQTANADWITGTR